MEPANETRGTFGGERLRGQSRKGARRDRGITPSKNTCQKTLDFLYRLE